MKIVFNPEERWILGSLIVRYLSEIDSKLSCLNDPYLTSFYYTQKALLNHSLEKLCFDFDKFRNL